MIRSMDGHSGRVGVLLEQEYDYFTPAAVGLHAILLGRGALTAPSVPRRLRPSGRPGGAAAAAGVAVGAAAVAVGAGVASEGECCGGCPRSNLSFAVQTG